MKYFFILAVLIFLALFTRLVVLLDVRDFPGRQPHTFSILGSGADQDYQMKCASLFARGQPSEFMTHYDYLFLCPMMAAAFAHFSFADALIVIYSVILLTGCFVAVTPFLLFSSRKRISIGGVIGSLMLIFNSVMIDNTAGRFYIYPLVSFMYALFVIALLKAVQKKTTFWIILFAVVTAIQSLNKPFLFVNDIPFMFVFFAYLAVDKLEFKKVFPFVSCTFHKSTALKAFYAVCTYFFITIAYEIFHHEYTNSFSFLTDLFVPTNGPSTKDAVLGVSLGFEGDPFQKFKNMYALAFVGTYQTLLYTQFALIIPAAFACVILSKKKWIHWLIASFVCTGFIFSFVYFTRSFLLFNNKYVGIEPFRFPVFFNMSIFSAFLLIVFFYSRKAGLLMTNHIFYFGALAMTLAAVQQPQLFVTNIIWVAILVSFAIQVGYDHFFKRFSKRISTILMLTLFCFFLIPAAKSVKWGVITAKNVRNEVHYLKWVKTELPEDAYILGGTDNLIMTSKFTQKPVLTNGFYVATQVFPNKKIWENTEFVSFPQFVSDQMKLPEKEQRLYILDHNIPKWVSYINSGASETYPKNKYKIVEVASSDYLHRKIYKLTNNPEYVPPSPQTQLSVK